MYSLVLLPPKGHSPIGNGGPPRTAPLRTPSTNSHENAPLSRCCLSPGRSRSPGIGGLARRRSSLSMRENPRSLRSSGHRWRSPPRTRPPQRLPRSRPRPETARREPPAHPRPSKPASISPASSPIAAPWLHSPTPTTPSTSSFQFAPTRTSSIRSPPPKSFAAFAPKASPSSAAPAKPATPTSTANDCVPGSTAPLRKTSNNGRTNTAPGFNFRSPPFKGRTNGLTGKRPPPIIPSPTTPTFSPPT